MLPKFLIVYGSVLLYSKNKAIKREGRTGNEIHFRIKVQPDTKVKKRYEVCFCHGLSRRELKYQRQVDLSITYGRVIFDEVLPKSKSFEDLEIEFEFPKIARKKMQLYARRIHEQGAAKDRVLLVVTHVTEKE